MKIVLNKCYGRFAVSKEAYELLGFKWDGYGSLTNEMFDIVDDNDGTYRLHPRLIGVVKTLGSEKASGKCACLKVVELNTDWYIKSHDGNESIEGEIYTN